MFCGSSLNTNDKEGTKNKHTVDSATLTMENCAKPKTRANIVTETSCKQTSNQKLYLCHLCDEFKTSSFEIIKYHLDKTHPPIKLYVCIYCNFESCDKNSVKMHMDLHGRLKEIIFPCQFCNFQIDNMEELQVHLEEMHRLPEEYEAQVEEFRKIEINKHNKCALEQNQDCIGHDEEYQTPLDQELVTIDFIGCPYCNFKTLKGNDLQEHVSIIHDMGKNSISSQDKTIICTNCNFLTINRKLLEKHINKEHSESIFSFPHHAHKTLCADQKTFSKDSKDVMLNETAFCSIGISNLAMDDDIDELHNEVVECAYCSLKITNKYLLKRHVKEEHSEFLYSCPHCSHKATRAGNLKTHINSKHTKEVLFLCHLCGFNTTTKTLLKVHVNSKHTFEKLYKCSHCKYISTRPGNLKTHIEGKHKMKVFKCHFCEKVFTQAGNLRNHMNKFHSEWL